MFSFIRAWGRRLRRKPSGYDERRQRLYAEERALAKAFREVFGAYERRLAYLEGRLLHESDEELARDISLFEDANATLTRVLHRLRIADAEEEALIREWHDWRRPNASIHELKQYGDRLELLRSELAIRKRLPIEAKKTESVQKTIQRTKPRPRYVPTSLSDDAFEAFDRVYSPRLAAHREYAKRAHRQLHRTAHHPVQALVIAKRVKQAHGAEKRFRRVLGV